MQSRSFDSILDMIGAAEGIQTNSGILGSGLDDDVSGRREDEGLQIVGRQQSYGLSRRILLSPQAWQC